MAGEEIGWDRLIRESRRIAREDRRDLLAQDLRQKYLRPQVPEDVAKRVFDKAWEDGHSAGDHEVEMHYDDLSEIANAAFKAGINQQARWPNG